MKHKKIIYLIIGLVLMIGITTGGVLAWLTDSKAITPITLTVGKVEYTWVPGTLKSNPVVPGDNLIVTEYKLTNSSTVSSELRIKIEVLHGQLDASDLVNLTLDPNWVFVEGVNSAPDYYYYREGTASNGKYPILISKPSVTVLTGLVLDGTVVGNDYSEEVLTIKITFEAKQNDHIAWADMGSINFTTGLA